MSGEYFDASNLYHFSAVALVFDGLGALCGSDSISDGALITRGRKYIGTYTVYADCTGGLTVQSAPGTSNLDFVITNNNRNVNLIRPNHETCRDGTTAVPLVTPVQ